MSEEIDEYIARLNNILTKSNKINIKDKSAEKTKNKNNKKTKNDSQLSIYNTIEQLGSLCKRAVILHTQGVYVRPLDSHACNKKKKKRDQKKLQERKTSSIMPKKAFGEGRVGVSCEDYGVKTCTCCAPRSHDENMLLMHMHTPFLNHQYEDPTDDYIDLTSSTSSSNKWDNSVISISDSSPNNSLISDDSLESTKIENVDLTQTNSRVENYANVENIIDYINLVTTDYGEDEMKKYEEEETDEAIIMNVETQDAVPNSGNVKETDIKSEVLELETVPNYANVENIIDYINLVTTDYDEEEMKRYEEEEMKRYEEEFAKTIHTTDIETLFENPENVPIATDNAEIASNSENVQIIKSPVASNCSPPGLTCPICLEHLNNKEVMSTICGHLFCADCIKEVIKKTKCCPNCRKKLNLKRIHPIYLG